MPRKLLVLTCALAALLLEVTALADESPAVARWIPREAVAVVEITRPEALLDPLLDPKLAAMITSLPAYETQSSNPGFLGFLAIVAHLEARLGMDWRAAVRKLIGGGATLAVGPDGEALLSINARDGRTLRQLHEIILEFAKGEAEKSGLPGRVSSREYRGITGWTLGPNEMHAIVGDRLLVTNRREVLKAVLDLRAQPDDDGSLLTLPAYKAAKKTIGTESVASIFVNMEALSSLRKSLGRHDNPLAALLLAGVLEAVSGANWLALDLGIERGTLTLKARIDGKPLDPSGPAGFALPRGADEGSLPNLRVPRRIAAMSLSRDLHRFYAAKDELFPERTSGLIFFENMMGIFFSGLDLTEEVFGETRPEIRVVVAEQEFGSAGTPAMQFPAVAVVLRLRHPHEFGEVVEEAWQKAVGLINFTRGQQALPGLIIDRPSHGETRFTVGYFRAPKTKNGTDLDSRYNVRPALAQLGDSLILSSTEGLARDLIDALEREKTKALRPSAETHSLVELDGPQLLSILRANRDNLVRQNMIEEGNTEEQAALEIDLLLTVLDSLGDAKLSVGGPNGPAQARLDLKLKAPGRAHAKSTRTSEAQPSGKAAHRTELGS